MKHYLAAYGVSLVVFAGLDALWLSQMTARLYRPALGALMAPTPKLAPAIIFYLLYVLGLVIFAVVPAGRWSGALWRGALFGFFTYMTYDLTNLATLRGWPASITLADIGWGTFASGVAATLAVLALR